MVRRGSVARSVVALLAAAAAACGLLPVEDPDPTPTLTVGFASAPLFAPVGISTGGYAQTPDKKSPKSPFATGFQATTTLVHLPRVQAMVLRTPSAELVIAQTDLIGIHQKIFARVADRLEAEIAGFSRDNLILAANHTHSGPGHIFDAFFAATVVDAFVPEIFNKQVEQIVSTVKQAYTDSAGGRQVRIGWAKLSNSEMHRDRRCENPELLDDTMYVLAIRPTVSGRAITLVNYAIHPTVFSAEQGLLGGDAARAVERALEQSTQGAVMFMQSWAGDMSPGHPKHVYAASKHPAAHIDGVDKIESLGRSAQLTLADLDSKLTWLDDPELRVVSREIAIDRAHLGYGKGEFDHEHGAILCGFGVDGCDPKNPPHMDACIPVKKGGGPKQVRLTTAAIGPLALVTLPGEPLTALGTSVVKRVVAETSADHALLLGYAQDYTGYLLFEDDW